MSRSDGDADAVTDAGDTRAADERGRTADEVAEPVDADSLGWRGWVVVVALVVSFVFVPWTLIFLPEVKGFVESLGLGFRDAYLVLPLVPALGLGVLAVWAAVANRRSS